MTSLTMQRAVALLMALCIVTIPVTRDARAAIISTDAAIEISDRDQRIDRVNALLARDSVRDVMIRFGVDPADASARVQSLTAEELQVLEAQLADLPAGGAGVVEVVGIVAIVLIVLELLNVTNFFTEF
jgi:hypothetical protein